MRSVTPRTGTAPPRGSSQRPLGVLSEAPGEGFDGEDMDEAPTNSTTPRQARDQAIPRVEDMIGLKVQETFELFLEKFEEEPRSSATPAPSGQTKENETNKYYIAQIHGLRTFQLSTLYVDYTHMTQFLDGTLARAVVEEYYRYLPFLTKGLHNMKTGRAHV